jgi:hypothetical protein
MRIIKFALTILTSLSLLTVSVPSVYAETQTGSVGIEGTIPSPAPDNPATIAIPANGQVFTELPITVSGLCRDGLLIKLFKNNIFSGSAQCTNGNYSIQIDLFNGVNELVARVYDSLDQAGPDSNIVRVTFQDSRRGATSRVSLSSNFAKRGANPGETLTWPIILSGGTGPYAISVDWGDGKEPDLLSEGFPGTFNIQHVYDNPGIYNILIKATDSNGGVAFLQLVGVANGPLSQETGTPPDESESGETVTREILWQPAAIMIPFLISTFWLGKRYAIYRLRQKIEKGERPF